jgi:hypothetical protein
MCLRFQIFTHQRVCILYFQKKSNSLYPNGQCTCNGKFAIFLTGLKFFLIQDKILGQYAKYWILNKNNNLQSSFTKSMPESLTTWCVK